MTLWLLNLTFCLSYIWSQYHINLNNIRPFFGKMCVWEREREREREREMDQKQTFFIRSDKSPIFMTWKYTKFKHSGIDIGYASHHFPNTEWLSKSYCMLNATILYCFALDKNYVTCILISIKMSCDCRLNFYNWSDSNMLLLFSLSKGYLRWEPRKL